MSIPAVDSLFVASPPTSNARELSSPDSGRDRPFQDQLQRAAGDQTDRQTTESDRSEKSIRETRSGGKDAEQESGRTTIETNEANESAPSSETEPTDELPTGDQIEVSVAAVAVLESQDQKPVPVPSQELAQEVQVASDQGETSEDELPVPIPTETDLLNPTGDEAQPEEGGPSSGTENLSDAAVEREAEIGSDRQAASEKTPDSSVAQAQASGVQATDSNNKQEPSRLEENGRLSQALQSDAESAPPEAETSSKQNQTAEKTNSEFSLASNATQAEGEVVERIVPAGPEGSLPANAAENDASQRPTAPDSIRTLERALGTRSVRADSAASQAETTTPVDRVRFVQRVGNALRTANQQEGHVQLRLSPPELGSLRIEITVRQGILTAKLETETVAARTVLLDNLPALRERLAEQDIRIEQFDVEVRRDGQQQAEDRSTDSQRSGNRSDDSRSQRNRETLEEEPETLGELLDGVASAITSEGLDVRI